MTLPTWFQNFSQRFGWQPAKPPRRRQPQRLATRVLVPEDRILMFGLTDDTYRMEMNSVPAHIRVIKAEGSSSSPSSSPLSIISHSNPHDAMGQLVGGTFVTNDGGELVYTPAPNFVGNLSFTYTAQDDNGEQAIGNVTVEVTAGSGSGSGTGYGSGSASAYTSSSGSGTGYDSSMGYGSSSGSGMGMGYDSSMGYGSSSGSGSGMGYDSSMGYGSSSGSGSGMGYDSGMGYGSGSGSGSGMGYDSGSGSNSGAGSGLGMSMGSSSGYGASSGMGLGYDSGMGSGMGYDSGSGMGLGSGSSSAIANTGLGLMSGLGYGMGTASSIGATVNTLSPITSQTYVNSMTTGGTGSGGSVMMSGSNNVSFSGMTNSPSNGGYTAETYAVGSPNPATEGADMGAAFGAVSLEDMKSVLQTMADSEAQPTSPDAATLAVEDVWLVVWWDEPITSTAIETHYSSYYDASNPDSNPLYGNHTVTTTTINGLTIESDVGYLVTTVRESGNGTTTTTTTRHEDRIHLGAFEPSAWSQFWSGYVNNLNPWSESHQAPVDGWDQAGMIVQKGSIIVGGTATVAVGGLAVAGVDVVITGVAAGTVIPASIPFTAATAGAVVAAEQAALVEAATAAAAAAEEIAALAAEVKLVAAEAELVGAVEAAALEEAALITEAMAEGALEAEILAAEAAAATPMLLAEIASAEAEIASLDAAIAIGEAEYAGYIAASELEVAAEMAEVIASQQAMRAIAQDVLTNLISCLPPF